MEDTLAVEGDWLVALQQDRGRGRHGRTWESIIGNFSGSTLIVFRPSDPPAPSLALAAGLALIEAVDEEVPGAQLCLKWPNDLMLGDAKLAGILLERSGDRIVAGFGVNLAGAPAIEGRKTASLRDLRSIKPEAFATVLADKFAKLLDIWRAAEPAQFAQAWLARAHPVGTLLRVHSGPADRISGSFDGIEPDGAMRLRRFDGSLDIVRAGDVYID